MVTEEREEHTKTFKIDFVSSTLINCKMETGYCSVVKFQCPYVRAYERNSISFMRLSYSYGKIYSGGSIVQIKSSAFDCTNLYVILCTISFV